MMRLTNLGCAAIAVSCAGAPRPFPLRAPLVVDSDTRPVSVACRSEPSAKEPARVRCAPAEFVSPFAWDYADNLVFAPLSRALAIEVSGEAANATSLDEVASSSWFENRIGAAPLSTEQRTLGACDPDDVLAGEVADGAWSIDHGKDNGSTEGFRVEVPGKGRYMLKADDPGVPERASAASVIGAAFYNAAGFSTTCEQIVEIRRDQLRLAPGLTTTSNTGFTAPFDAAALDAVLASSTQVAGRIRMQASKWLPGLALGPFRYAGVRDDDPNDAIAHEDRRELRGSRLLAAWLNHWDAREQNTMDLWLASDARDTRSSPGYVRHYIIDTSDAIGGGIASAVATRRLGHAYLVSLRDVMLDFVTLGLVERPWDRARSVAGREKFGVFSARDFDPEHWRGAYPNPAMLRMTERDAAWMARIIARFTGADVRAIAASGRFSDARDTEYLARILIDRQHEILVRYLTRLSPLSDVHPAGGGRLCALDLARSSAALPADQFHYGVVEIAADRRVELVATPAAGGTVCFHPISFARGELRDDAAERRVVFELSNGTAAGPLEIHAYDLGPRGMFVVGLKRPAP
jgi:hypothetical protein